MRLFPRAGAGVWPLARATISHIHEHYGNFSPGYFPPPPPLRDRRAMMDEVGHAVIENTISLAVSPVKQKSREKE